MIEAPGMKHSLVKQLLIILLAIVCIKAVFLALDSRPAYSLGDSQAYLGTAISDYIPPDRSFAYGFVLRLVALGTHSLSVMVRFQVLLSAISCWLVSFVLLKYFRVRFWIAVLCGVLCACEPLQLSLERFVMTETVANFLFACYFCLAVAYVRNGSLWILLAGQVTGISLLAIRISFYPQAMLYSVLVPVLSPQAQALWRSACERWKKLSSSRPSPKLLWTVAAHVSLSVLLTQSLLTGYKHLNGYLIHRPPKLFYDKGYFLLIDVLPIVKPEDCPIASLRPVIFSGLKLDIHSTRNRFAEHWANGEIIDRLEKLSPNQDVGAHLANTIAMHALKRDPLGAAGLMLRGFADYFDYRFFLSCLKIDEGIGRPLPADFVQLLKTTFHVVNPVGGEPSITKTWSLVALPWYCLLLCLLLISPLLLIRATKEDRAVTVLCVVTALIFFEGATLTIDRPTARFLTSGAWLFTVLLGIALQQTTGDRDVQGQITEHTAVFERL